MSKLSYGLMLVTVIALSLCGCGNGGSKATDQKLARGLVDSIYAGSALPIRDSLAEPIRRAMPDSVVGRISALVQPRFGAVRGIKLQSSQAVGMGYQESVWNVIAERGSFGMKMTVDKSGKVTGIWFRFSSTEDWVPAHLIGLNYTK